MRVGSELVPEDLRNVQGLSWSATSSVDALPPHHSIRESARHHSRSFPSCDPQQLKVGFRPAPAAECPSLRFVQGVCRYIGVPYYLGTLRGCGFETSPAPVPSSRVLATKGSPEKEFLTQGRKF